MLYLNSYISTTDNMVNNVDYLSILKIGLEVPIYFVALVTITYKPLACFVKLFISVIYLTFCSVHYFHDLD